VDFAAVREVGHGTFGQVVKVTHRLDRRHYAVKRLEIGGDGGSLLDGKLLREVSTLSRLSHPHVVRYYQAWVEEGSRCDAAGDGDDGWWGALTREEGEEEEEEDEGMAISPPRRAHDDGSADIFSFDTGDFPDLPGSPRSSPVRRFLFIQMEFCQFTLADLIEAGSFSTREVLWDFFRQILQGLSYVHGQGIMHRDIKPANIFVSGEPLEGQESTALLRTMSPATLATLSVKLGDFGLAKEVPSQPPPNAAANNPPTAPGSDALPSRPAQGLGCIFGGASGARASTGIGTLLYVPPGLRNMWDRKADMYSLGVVLFEMAHPFKTQMERVISLDRLRRREPVFPIGFETSNFRAAIRIRRLLQRDPAQRPSADELLMDLAEVSAHKLRRCESSPRLSSHQFEWPPACPAPSPESLSSRLSQTSHVQPGGAAAMDEGGGNSPACSPDALADEGNNGTQQQQVQTAEQLRQQLKQQGETVRQLRRLLAHREQEIAVLHRLLDQRHYASTHSSDSMSATQPAAGSGPGGAGTRSFIASRRCPSRLLSPVLDHRSDIVQHLPVAPGPDSERGCWAR